MKAWEKSAFREWGWREEGARPSDTAESQGGGKEREREYGS